MSREAFEREEAIFTSIAQNHANLKYHSPIETLINRSNFMSTNSADNLVYSGSLLTVLNELNASLKFPNEENSLKYKIFHPARVIRALIDFKINHPENLGIHQYILDAIKINLAIFQDNSSATKDLEDFTKKIYNNDSDLLNIPIQQKQDMATWLGTDPELSYKAALNVAFQLLGEDIFFIALAHGGTIAGMDVFLRYLELSGNSNSDFYVARFSRNKHQDKQLQLDEIELDYIREKSKGKHIVVFEEDSVKHRTYQDASNYLKSIFSETDIIAICNAELGHFTPNN